MPLMGQKRSIFRPKGGYAAYGSEKYHRVMDGGLKCQLIAFLLKSLQNKRLCQKKALICVLQYTAANGSEKKHIPTKRRICCLWVRKEAYSDQKEDMLI
jgi:hypothetical protein